MKIVLFSSSDFSIPILKSLLASEHQVVRVVTVPDKKKGRGQKLVPSAVRLFASTHGLSLAAPEKLADPQVASALVHHAADFFVIASYGKMIPASIFSRAKVAALNVHPSLLPRHRGAAPIQRAIAEGDTKTGVSIAEVTRQLDAGDLFGQVETEIGENENALELTHRLSQLGASLLLQVLAQFEGGGISRTPQDEHQATYAAKLEKEFGRIDWAQQATSLHRLIRACVAWPSAFTFFRGKRLKILGARVVPSGSPSRSPGTILNVSNQTGVQVATGSGVLALEQVQLEGRRPMSGFEFALGQRLEAGSRFGH